MDKSTDGTLIWFVAGFLLLLVIFHGVVSRANLLRDKLHHRDLVLLNSVKGKQEPSVTREEFTSRLIRTLHCGKCHPESECGRPHQSAIEARCCQGANGYCYHPLPVTKESQSSIMYRDDTFDCPRGIAGHANKCYCPSGSWCGPAKHHDTPETLGKEGPPIKPKYDSRLPKPSKKKVNPTPKPTPTTKPTTKPDKSDHNGWLKATASNYGDFHEVTPDKISCSDCDGCDGHKYLGKTPCLMAKRNCPWGSDCCQKGGLDQRAGGGCYKIKCSGGVPGSSIACRTRQPIVMKVVDDCKASSTSHFVRSTGRSHLFDLNDQALSQIATGLGPIQVDYKQVSCSELPDHGESSCFPKPKDKDAENTLVKHYV